MTQGARRQPGPIVLWLILLLAAAPSFAQSLGDLARQERERRKNQPPRATRVYTNEDLKKPQILGPADRARIQAARESHPAAAPPELPAEVPAAIPAAASEPAMAPLRAEVSLGEVARYYRRLKELRERAEQRPVVHSLATQATMKRPAETRVLAANAFPKRSPLRPAPLPRQDNFSSPAGVVVERGDSLWKLAKRHLGSGARWRQLAALNPELPNPDRLRIGAWVRLPMGASKETKQFRVRAGDTLWKVAQSEYGTSRAWACIARANPQLPSADLILPGEVLALPLACAAAPTP